MGLPKLIFYKALVFRTHKKMLSLVVLTALVYLEGKRKNFEWLINYLLLQQFET